MDPADGGSLELPKLLYSVAVPGVTIGHSAAFTWDGGVIVFGHEPGGGGQARCQATSATVDKTLLFFDADTGAKVGEFVNPRPQTATENCTWHNYNVVPTARGNILVAAQYQGGISVVDFTDPSAAKEIAYADPAPLSATQLILGGDWSDYWYTHARGCDAPDAPRSFDACGFLAIRTAATRGANKRAPGTIWTSVSRREPGGCRH